MKVSASSNMENLNVSAKNAAKRAQESSASFGKAPNRALYDAIRSKTSSMARGLEFLGTNDGEILNTLVTAVGTAFVAPIFIAFNPFSKEDKETKVYSAWRQPISAVIAAIVQIAINMKYNSHINKLASTGGFQRADLRAFPVPGYLRAIVKMEHPDWDKKAIDTEVERRQYEIKDKAVRSARENYAYRVFADAELVDKKAIEQAKEEIKEKYKDYLSRLTKKEKEKFIEKKAYEIAPSVARKQVEESAKIKSTIREWVKEQVKTEGLNIENVRKKNGSLIPNIKFADFVEAKIQELARLKETGASPEQIKFFEHAIEKLEGYKGFENIKGLGDSFEKLIQNIKIKKYIQAGIDNSKAVLSGYKRWTGIVISLITLPFSCGLLNYAYPRIMEKIMPQAAARKKKQQQQMLSSSAPLNPQQTVRGKEVGK